MVTDSLNACATLGPNTRTGKFQGREIWEIKHVEHFLYTKQIIRLWFFNLKKRMAKDVTEVYKINSIKV